MGPGLGLRISTMMEGRISYFRESGGIEGIPEFAQVSPITKTIVRDLNNDSYPDVILAGNDHTYDISTGYYDANKGIILLSKDNRPLIDLLPPPSKRAHASWNG